MSLTPGTRLGPYEIVAPVGAGGMGEVYRGKDTRLGRDELYVRSYPVAGQRQQLTTNGIANWYGGLTVDWSRDGRELLLFDGAVRVMQVETGPTLKAGPPRLLFTAPSGVVGFSATADHQRFLVVEPVADAEPAAIELDLNWAAGLQKR